MSSEITRSEPNVTDAQRCNEHDRSAAIDALGRHYANGYIDRDEHDVRVAKAMVAETKASLKYLLRDLPEVRPVTQTMFEERPSTAVLAIALMVVGVLIGTLPWFFTAGHGNGVKAVSAAALIVGVGVLVTGIAWLMKVFG